jgi:hypothetical protein
MPQALRLIPHAGRTNPKPVGHRLIPRARRAKPKLGPSRLVASAVRPKPAAPRRLRDVGPASCLQCGRGQAHAPGPAAPPQCWQIQPQASCASPHPPYAQGGAQAQALAPHLQALAQGPSHHSRSRRQCGQAQACCPAPLPRCGCCRAHVLRVPAAPAPFLRCRPVAAAPSEVNALLATCCSSVPAKSPSPFKCLASSSE